MQGNKQKVKQLAEKHDWNYLCYQKDSGMISFHKIIDSSFARINIYLTKMTVATCLKHPRQGKTQMFRKFVSMELLEKIFKNPRTHTGRGYK